MMHKAGKVLIWLMLLTLFLTGAAAENAPLPRAAAPVQSQAFSHYPSYTLDEAAGVWRVNANQADALLDRFWAYAARNKAAACVFHLALEGSADTGVWSPVLRIYYTGQKPIAATAVSLLVDGVRCDLAASSSAVARDGQRAELISAPLTPEALTAVQTMVTGEAVSLRLMGETVYTTTLDAQSTNARRSLEAASLTGLGDAMSLMNAAGLADYALWDLSAAAWKSRYGYAPACAVSEVIKTVRGVSVTDAFGMVLPDQEIRAARAAQEALIESGFLSGSATVSFGENAVSATKRAQTYLGMIVTGCMDAQTEQALLAGRTTSSAAAAELTSLGGRTELTLNRYWFAPGVSASASEQSLHTAGNADNLLLVADGQLRNLSADTLYLFMQLEAKVIYNDEYVYEATVLCQRDEDTLLDTTLLPMAQSRLIVCAELPAPLAMDSQAAWRIELTANGETIRYDLQ